MRARQGIYDTVNTNIKHRDLGKFAKSQVNRKCTLNMSFRITDVSNETT